MDLGGPTRKFFRLVIQEFEMNYLRGRQGSKYMATNVTALQVLHFKF